MFLSLKSVELVGFKSFGKKTELVFTSAIASIVGPNGSGKSNVAEAFRFVLGEQSMKAMRGRRGEDLIWGGSPALPRASRAAVKVVFDNSKRLLDIDFREVVIERVVYRDGQNDYLLNGTVVRLKDVVRLLAGANIGGSGYQIISQGEADRILNASPRERREMVEDALGLKLYQHKKAESERKLEETAANIDKTRSLRRELAPHLNFLRAQVEKIEKAREMKEELSALLSEYLARENAYITQESAHAKEEERALSAEVRAVEGAIAKARERFLKELPAEEKKTFSELETRRAQARRLREETARELGRAEAALEFAKRAKPEGSVPAREARSFAERISRSLSEADSADSLEAVRTAIAEARRGIEEFLQTLGTSTSQTSEEVSAKEEIARLAEILKRATADEEAVESAIVEVRRAGESEREARHEAERTLLTHEATSRELSGKLSAARKRLEELSMLRQKFEEEVREGIALIGAGVHSWERADIPDGALSEDRSEQERRRRAAERLKIKIEEAGAGRGDEVVKEFVQTKERDEYLARELIDLETSAEKLRDLIAELEKTIDLRFTEGVKRINEALGNFFSKLFGGGEAKLTIDEPRRRSSKGVLAQEDEEDGDMPEEEELYAGLSISVSLPRKKVRGLEVLSGGERALTSIALIFSMSQVNPPPFLILDETDAALDEANSRRYADMIRELSAKSQLIVITHNRATMAAAGELYGVTMDSSGVSKVLSVKFGEATKVAK